VFLYSNTKTALANNHQNLLASIVHRNAECLSSSDQ